jgi:hypothetical protein
MNSEFAHSGLYVRISVHLPEGLLIVSLKMERLVYMPLIRERDSFTDLSRLMKE